MTEPLINSGLLLSHVQWISKSYYEYLCFSAFFFPSFLPVYAALCHLLSPLHIPDSSRPMQRLLQNSLKNAGQQLWHHTPELPW